MCAERAESALTTLAHSSGGGFPQRQLQLHFLPEFWVIQCMYLTTPLGFSLSQPLEPP